MSSMGAMYRGNSSHDREYLLDFLYGREAPTRYCKVGKVPTVLLKPAMLLYMVGMYLPGYCLVGVPTKLLDCRDIPTMQATVWWMYTYQAIGL